MKSKIRVLSLLLALAMMSTMFVACKKKTDDTKSGVTGEPVNLIWYHWGDKPKEAEPVVAELNRLSKEAINTTVDFRFTGGSDEQLKTILSTGGEFDIAFTCSWFANYVVAAQNNQLADITDKLPTVTPKLWEYIPQNAWDGSRVNGRIYAVPTYKDSAAAQYWLANKEYVIDGAKAEAEFKATGKKLSTVTPLLQRVKAYADAGNPYPHDLTAPLNFNWSGLNGLNNGWDTLGLDNLRIGVKITDGNTKVQSFFDDAEFIEDLRTLKSWYDNGFINKGASELEQEPEFIVVSTAQGWEGAEAVWGNGKDYTVTINKKYGPIYTTNSIQGSMNGISPNSKNIDAALKYLEYANTNKDYRNTLAYGIKDKNWKVNDQGQAENLTGDAWSPGVFSQASFFELYPLAPAPADMYVKLKATNDAAEASPLVGFVPNTDAIQTEVAACVAVMEKHFKYFQTGNTKDLDALVTTIKKELKQAGIDKVLSNLQTQIDEFIAAK